MRRTCVSTSCFKSEECSPLVLIQITSQMRRNVIISKWPFPRVCYHIEESCVLCHLFWSSSCTTHNVNQAQCSSLNTRRCIPTPFAYEILFSCCQSNPLHAGCINVLPAYDMHFLSNCFRVAELSPKMNRTKTLTHRYK